MTSLASFSIAIPPSGSRSYPRFSASALSAGSFSALAKALRRITNKPRCVQHRARIQVGEKINEFHPDCVKKE